MKRVSIPSSLPWRGYGVWLVLPTSGPLGTLMGCKKQEVLSRKREGAEGMQGPRTRGCRRTGLILKKGDHRDF